MTRHENLDGDRAEMLLRRRLGGLSLAAPLMRAIAAKPGVPAEDLHLRVVDSVGLLITRTRDLVRRIVETLDENGVGKVNRFVLTQETARLIAEHWDSEGEVPPAALERLVIATISRSGPLMEIAGEERRSISLTDREDRLTALVLASQILSVGMLTVNPLGHQTAELCRKFVKHLGDMATQSLDRLGVGASTYVYQTLLREFAQLYPTLWLNEVLDVKRQLTEGRSVPEGAYPLDDFLTRVESMIGFILDLALEVECFFELDEWTESDSQSDDSDLPEDETGDQ